MNRWLVFIFSVLALLSAPVEGAEDWPQFRGPTGQGISNATGVPVEWNAHKNIAWKMEIPGRGWSSPVLARGELYLTTSTGETRGPIELHAICLDAGDGKILWDTMIFQPEESEARMMHQKNSLASPTPVVTDDRLYVHLVHLGTAALDLNGKIIWRENSIKYPPVHGTGCSPVLLGDTLYFSCDGLTNPFLAALDAKTGDVKWKSPRNAVVHKTFSFCTPLAIEVDGRTQLISPASGYVGAFDPQTGREIWRVNYGEGYSVVPRPIFADGFDFHREARASTSR